MKGKKILSSLLAITLLMGMMASPGISALAKSAAEYGVAETFTFTILNSQLGEDDREGNVKDIQVDSEKSSAAASIVSAVKAGNDIAVSVTASTAGTLCISWSYYNGESWSSDFEEFVIYPLIEVGQSYTYLIEEAVLSEEAVKDAIKDISCSDTAIILSKTQVEDGVQVVLKGVKEGKVLLTYQRYCGSSFGWEEVGDYAVKVKAASTSAFLDLDSSTAMSDHKDIDQNYTLSVVESIADEDKIVTKVKLSWEIKDINATRTDNKVWNSSDLCWETSTSATLVTQAGSAKFTLENYSTVKVDASVSFDTAEYAEGKKFSAPTLAFDEATGSDGKITLDTANGNDSYSASNVPSAEISVTLTPDENDFETLSATTTARKYGTYTVSIRKSLPESFTLYGFFNGEKEDASIDGMDASALCQYMLDNGMISKASDFGSVLVKSTYFSRAAGGFITDAKALSLLFDNTHQEAVNVTRDNLAGDNDYTQDKVFFTYFNGSFSWDGSSFVKNAELV